MYCSYYYCLIITDVKGVGTWKRFKQLLLFFWWMYVYIYTLANTARSSTVVLVDAHITLYTVLVFV